MEPAEYDTIARLETAHWWYVGMRRIAEQIVADIAAGRSAYRAGRPLRILDAGCGTGGGIAWLAAHGEVTGIDWHPRAIHYAAAKTVRLARAVVESLPLASGSFDLVTAFDVLYHRAVADDVQALRECARVLRPGGWLVLRVPAYNWLRGAHDRQVHTRQRYGRSELRRKLVAGGFQPVRLTGAGLALMPLAVVRRLAQGGGPAKSDVRMPAPPVNAALGAVLAVEARWLRRHNLPAGLSLLAVARKAGP